MGRMTMFLAAVLMSGCYDEIEGTEVAQTERVVPAAIIAVSPAPASHPAVSREFVGSGLHRTTTFALYPGTVTVSVQHNWTPGASEFFSAELSSADEQPFYNGALVNEVSLHSAPRTTPVDVHRSITLRTGGTFVINVNADPGRTWSVQVEQAAQ